MTMRTDPSSSTRREALRLLGLGGAATLAMPRLAFATAATEKRFVFFILRGGMDGLAALMPVGDPGFARLRGEFLDRQPVIPLDATFALHGSLASLKPFFDAGELLPVHAVASSHRDRSHFLAQDQLEAGLDRPHSGSAGWLNRLLAEHDGTAGRRRLGLAAGATVPLALRGPVAIDSAAPDRLPGAPGDFVERMMALWSEDPTLGAALAGMPMAAADEGGPRNMAGGGMGAAANLQATVGLARMAASRLARADGPRIAAIELNGFDTHSAEANRLVQLFDALSQALTALAEGLRPVWRDTVILAVSEFGRTAMPNGSGGTDHGTGGAGFLLGGAVNGGRVLADWPGLKPPQLYQDRDVKPTLHLTALYKGIAAAHFGLDGRAQMARLFPDAGDIRAADIIRG
jgi:uncharacterized protein (DUF1501 family)